MTQQESIALVTGASSGIGREFVRQLAPECGQIIAVARRESRLTELSRELGDQCEIVPIVADLSEVEGVSRCVEIMRQKGPVTTLVNNAGFGTYGKFAKSQIDGQDAMVALHISASIRLCRAAIPYMQEAGGGTLINVSSVGSFMQFTDSAVYAATKAFLNQFSLCLQEEVRATGIDVQALCPGFTHSEIHDSATMDQFDKSWIEDRLWMSPQSVVQSSLEARATGTTLVIPGEDNQSMARIGLQGVLDQL